MSPTGQDGKGVDVDRLRTCSLHLSPLTADDTGPLLVRLGGPSRNRRLLRVLAGLRLGRSAWWLAPGIVALIIFAWTLTRIDVPFAGRAYAAYGGVCIAASVMLLWLMEQARPDRWDLIGAGACPAGTLQILLGPRPPG